MSEENIEIVRRHMAAYAAGDYEAALAVYHPEVVCDATVRPEGRIYRGREGMAEAILDWVGTWDDWRYETEELIDEGAGTGAKPSKPRDFGDSGSHRSGRLPGAR
jgi:ketosteroid isomerase-like protein